MSQSVIYGDLCPHMAHSHMVSIRAWTTPRVGSGRGGEGLGGITMLQLYCQLHTDSILLHIDLLLYRKWTVYWISCFCCWICCCCCWFCTLTFCICTADTDRHMYISHSFKQSEEFYWQHRVEATPHIWLADFIKEWLAEFLESQFLDYAEHTCYIYAIHAIYYGPAYRPNTRINTYTYWQLQIQID